MRREVVIARRWSADGTEYITDEAMQSLADQAPGHPVRLGFGGEQIGVCVSARVDGDQVKAVVETDELEGL